MSERLKIMANAEEAKLCLITYDRSQGERQFEKLIEQHSLDGMLYFKLAEAYEEINESRRALDAFKRAQELFPMPEWKGLARQGIERCRADLQFVRLPLRLRKIWKDVSRLQHCPPRALAMTARAAVEVTADFFIKEYRLGVSPEDTLDNKLQVLQRSRKVPAELIKDMRTVKMLGDPAAHGVDIKRDEAENSYNTTQRIVEYLKVWKRT
jgi:tetratricopeptide (TPR) repeat protein